ncbi:esterase/lipase [Cenarchaeum symbiosum A]|uniref:Esterase/lipase n=1 Tax=Cenarchaeum symbiosum (strain A) TaxID=414004 RepID=A0RVZ5_CENSY|nr:esterase/lipase [Cenarchaeum symbiosum A]
MAKSSGAKGPRAQFPAYAASRGAALQSAAILAVLALAASAQPALAAGPNDAEPSCTEIHVLVERPNGKLACVTEETAGRLSWRILDAEAPEGAAPTLSDVPYGTHERNVFDFWRADSAGPAPLMIYIHGGGFVSGDKSDVDKDDKGKIKEGLLDRGISVISINYPFLDEARIDGIVENASQIIPYVQDNAEELGIDPGRVGIYGGSGGGGIALHLGLGEYSDQVSVIGHITSQSTYDLLQWFDILGIDPGDVERAPPGLIAAVLQLYHVGTLEEFEEPEIVKLRKAMDMPSFMDADDPPVYIQNYLVHDGIGNKGDVTHHPSHAVFLKEKCDEAGLECVLNLAGTPEDRRVDAASFFDRMLRQES